MATAKRFTDDGVEEIENQSFTDNLTDKTYWIDNGLDEIVELLNALHEENQSLKQGINEVKELLLEEVDVFSDKATEHDINAYIELKELDNKDAYYIATATKKSIKILKELQ